MTLNKFKTDYEIWAKFSLNFVLFKLLEAFATFALLDEEKLYLSVWRLK